MPALEGWRPRHVLPNPPRCFDTFSRRRALVTLPVNSFESLFMTRPTEEKPRREKRKLVHIVFNSSHILVFKYAWLSHNAVGLFLTYVMATTAKTPLGKWIRAVSNFTTLVQFHKICLLLVFFSAVNSKGLYLSWEKGKENCCLVLTSSIKRKTRMFHVVLVQQ